MKIRVSKALTEVWKMKQKVHEETIHLTGPAYFRFMREEAARLFPDIPRRTARSHGAAPSASPAEDLPRRVAEAHATYGKR